MTLINENQSQSAGAYITTIRTHSKCSADFITSQLDRIELKYNSGEPVQMAIDELNFIYETRKTAAKTIKPYSIAKAVTRNGVRIK